jgi:hypothetical protein
MPIRCGQPLSPSKLTELEALAGYKLPKDYVSFLCRWNGMIVDSPEYVDLPFTKVDNGEISFQALYSFSVKNENFDLIFQNKTYGSELSFLDFPFLIGEDPGGNYYLIALYNGSYSILYWDKTHLHAEDLRGSPDVAGTDECGALYLVANSFESFWQMISVQLNNFERITIIEQVDWPS